MDQSPGLVHRLSSSDEKIALFRSLFRGRDDVYPRRFESRKTGKSGYAPACANEWARGICEKPRIKCAECPNRRFLPVTDDVIRWHLSGYDDAGQRFVAGVYPMLLDETCFFLAVDFDKTGWLEDSAAYIETCRALSLSAALERSRSGRGGHVWLLFDEAVPAALARKVGSYILTETMERQPDIGFDSYDRFFPNQDTLPHGGFGNLIALPLQKHARGNGDSVFLDDQAEPHGDQWAFLSTVQRIGRAHLEAIARDADRRGRVLGVSLPPAEDDEPVPWAAPPSRRRTEPTIVGELPDSLELILGNEIYVAKDGLAPGLRNRLLRVAAFQNPEFYKTQAMRLSAYAKPRVISCAEEHPQHIGLPRGCLEDVRAVLIDLNIRPIIRDERVSGHPLHSIFQGELRTEQKLAAEAMLKHETGVLAATTAFGKTVVTAWLIAQRGVNTLVLVHRRQLMDQWIERLATFLDLPAKSVGRIGGGRNKPTGLIDVAVIQSLVRKGVVNDRVAEYGQVIVDECHHVSAHSFEQVARRSKARFVLGLSATVTRKDGHHPIIFMQCGPVRHRVDARARLRRDRLNTRSSSARRDFNHTDAGADKRVEFQALYQQLVVDETRNRAICEEVLQSVRDGRSPLILTERNEHLDRFESVLSTSVPHVVVLRGGVGKKQRRVEAERLAGIPRGEGRVILATGKYIGEGFDDPRLDTLFLTLPVSWRGTIAQYVGRLHRLYDGKREVQVYDYAASVRRLVRDGVDTPLANLFVTAARPIPSEAEGANRARSASEAFLYRRLETLPETRGRFQMNADLPIAFDGWGRMEVDLLCTESRVVVEVDGAQHLADPVAYRRDRRKDQLLQENGYLGCAILPRTWPRSWTLCSTGLFAR